MLKHLRELTKELEGTRDPEELEFVCAKIHAILDRLYRKRSKKVAPPDKEAQTEA